VAGGPGRLPADVDPEVAEQPENDARHAAEVRAVPPILSEVARQIRDDDEQREDEGAATGFDLRAELEQPVHIADEVHDAEVQEHRREQSP